MGAVKAAMFEQASQMYLDQFGKRVTYMDMAYQMQMALEAILLLDPAETNEGMNEWGEAECFHQARKIARNALKAVSKEYENGSK